MQTSPSVASAPRLDEGRRGKEPRSNRSIAGSRKCDVATNLPSPVPRLFSVEQIAKLVGISGRTVRRWIDDKQLPVHRLGRLIRISETDFIAFVQSRRS
jgi:excisionase family DNA binding protein